jgi:hypothetical protein
MFSDLHAFFLSYDDGVGGRLLAPQ